MLQQLIDGQKSLLRGIDERFEQVETKIPRLVREEVGRQLGRAVPSNNESKSRNRDARAYSNDTDSMRRSQHTVSSTARVRANMTGGPGSLRTKLRKPVAQGARSPPNGNPKHRKILKDIGRAHPPPSRKNQRRNVPYRRRSEQSTPSYSSDSLPNDGSQEEDSSSSAEPSSAARENARPRPKSNFNFSDSDESSADDATAPSAREDARPRALADGTDADEAVSPQTPLRATGTGDESDTNERTGVLLDSDAMYASVDGGGWNFGPPQPPDPTKGLPAGCPPHCERLEADAATGLSYALNAKGIYFVYWTGIHKSSRPFPRHFQYRTMRPYDPGSTKRKIATAAYLNEHGITFEAYAALPKTRKTSIRKEIEERVLSVATNYNDGFGSTLRCLGYCICVCGLIRRLTPGEQSQWLKNQGTVVADQHCRRHNNRSSDCKSPEVHHIPCDVEIKVFRYSEGVIWCMNGTHGHEHAAPVHMEVPKLQAIADALNRYEPARVADLKAKMNPDDEEFENLDKLKYVINYSLKRNGSSNPNFARDWQKWWGEIVRKNPDIDMISHGHGVTLISKPLLHFLLKDWTENHDEDDLKFGDVQSGFETDATHNAIGDKKSVVVTTVAYFRSSGNWLALAYSILFRDQTELAYEQHFYFLDLAIFHTCSKHGIRFREWMLFQVSRGRIVREDARPCARFTFCRLRGSLEGCALGRASSRATGFSLTKS